MTLRQEAFDLDVQDGLVTAVDMRSTRSPSSLPGVKVLRLGAVFFADQGARTAIDEATSWRSSKRWAPF